MNGIDEQVFTSKMCKLPLETVNKDTKLFTKF